MIQAMRDRLQSWVTWVIVILICLSFMMWGVSGYMHSSAAADQVAEVNGQAIYKHQVNLIYERMREQIRLQLGKELALDEQMVAQLKQRALEQLILSQVMLDFIEKQGFTVPQVSLMDYVTANPGFQVEGKFSPQRFHEIALRLRLTDQDLLVELRRNLLSEQLRVGLLDSAFISPKKAQQAFELLNQQRDISWVQLPTQLFLSQAKVTDEEVKAAYEKNRHNLISQPVVSIDYVKLSLAELRAQQSKQVAEDEKALREFYQQHVQEFTTPARWHVAQLLLRLPEEADLAAVDKAKQKLSQLASQLAQGKDFSDLAKQHSEDLFSAKKGGELPWFDVNTEIDPALKQAVMSLTKPNQVSAPVRTRYGLSLIKLLQTQAASQQSFADAKARIIELRSEQQAQARWVEYKDKLADLSYTHPKSLQEASDLLKLPIKKTATFTKQGLREGMASHKLIVDSAFSPDVLEQGNNSDLLEVSPEEVVVLRVAKHIPARQLTFAEIKDKARQAMAEEKAYALARNEGLKILAELKQGHLLADVAKLHKVSWQKAEKIKRSSEQYPKAVIEKAFELAIDETDPAAKAALVPLDKQNLALVVLEKVQLPTAPTQPKDNDELAVLRDDLEHSLGQLDYELFVAGQMQQAKIQRLTNSSTE